MNRKEGKKKEKKEKKEKKISAEMSFAEILQKYPVAEKIFMKYGLGCAFCPFASQESLEIGARAHGIDIKKLLAELNKLVNKKKNEA